MSKQAFQAFTPTYMQSAHEQNIYYSFQPASERETLKLTPEYLETSLIRFLVCWSVHISNSVLSICAGSAVSGSLSRLQGPKGADATLPHCADRGGDLLLWNTPLSSCQTGHQGREWLGWDASGTRVQVICPGARGSPWVFQLLLSLRRHTRTVIVDLLGFVLEALEKELSRGFLCACRWYYNALCVLVQESVPTSEPIHAMTCCTSHVLSWTHFTSHPTHRTSLAPHSCCQVEREELKVPACSHVTFSISWDLRLLLPVHVLLNTWIKIWAFYYRRSPFCNMFSVLVVVVRSSAGICWGSTCLSIKVWRIHTPTVKV